MEEDMCAYYRRLFPHTKNLWICQQGSRVASFSTASSWGNGIKGVFNTTVDSTKDAVGSAAEMIDVAKNDLIDKSVDEYINLTNRTLKKAAEKLSGPDCTEVSITTSMNIGVFNVSTTIVNKQNH